MCLGVDTLRLWLLFVVSFVISRGAKRCLLLVCLGLGLTEILLMLLFCLSLFMLLFILLLLWFIVLFTLAKLFFVLFLRLIFGVNLLCFASSKDSSFWLALLLTVQFNSTKLYSYSSLLPFPSSVTWEKPNYFSIPPWNLASKSFTKRWSSLRAFILAASSSKAPLLKYSTNSQPIPTNNSV